ELTERGQGGRRADRAAARALYERGCDAGAAEACHALAALGARDHGATRAELAQLDQRAYDLALAQAKGNPYYASVAGTYRTAGAARERDWHELDRRRRLMRRRRGGPVPRSSFLALAFVLIATPAVAAPVTVFLDAHGGTIAGGDDDDAGAGVSMLASGGPGG